MSTFFACTVLLRDVFCAHARTLGAQNGKFLIVDIYNAHAHTAAHTSMPSLGRSRHMARTTASLIPLA